MSQQKTAPIDASKFARTEEEILLGGKEVGTKALGLGTNIDETPQFVNPGNSSQIPGIPSGAGSGGTLTNSSVIQERFSTHDMPGQGFQGGQNATSEVESDGISGGIGKVAGYQSGFATGQTGEGGIHLSGLNQMQPQAYGTPNPPGAGEKGGH